MNDGEQLICESHSVMDTELMGIKKSRLELHIYSGWSIWLDAEIRHRPHEGLVLSFDGRWKSGTSSKEGCHVASKTEQA